jgi:hypothetical protein
VMFVLPMSRASSMVMPVYRAAYENRSLALYPL